MSMVESPSPEAMNPAWLDPLTGIPNRLPLHSTVDFLVEHEPGTFGIIVADANGLKAINDSEGHQAGDEYIMEVAVTLHDGVRHNREQPEDNDINGLAARTGGDEFVVVLRNVDQPDQINSIMQRLQNRLIDKGLSVSMGYALHTLGMSKAELLHTADMYMNLHKRNDKLERINEEQTQALVKIGQLALLANIDIRDVPALVTALQERDQAALEA